MVGRLSFRLAKYDEALVWNLERNDENMGVLSGVFLDDDEYGAGISVHRMAVA